MKKALFLFLVPIFLFSFDYKKEYSHNNFEKICKYGIKHIQKIRDDENLLTLVGFSCVKADSFIYLPTVVTLLKKTTQARQNSIYFSILYIEKKLLIANIIDGMDISYYKFPYINHPVSIVVNALINNDYKKKNGVVIIKKDDKTYVVYKNDENKVFIQVYKYKKLQETHWYR